MSRFYNRTWLLHGPFMEHSSQPYEKLGEPLYGTCFQNMIGTRWGLNNSWLYTTDKDMPSLAALSHMCNYSQSPSGRMCQKRHVFEMFEITYFHPFRDLDIVLGRRDYHHLIHRMRFYLETVVSLLS